MPFKEEQQGRNRKNLFALFFPADHLLETIENIQKVSSEIQKEKSNS